LIGACDVSARRKYRVESMNIHASSIILKLRRREHSVYGNTERLGVYYKEVHIVQVTPILHTAKISNEVGMAKKDETNLSSANHL